MPPSPPMPPGTESVSEDEPMQLGFMHLSEVESLYCGQKDKPLVLVTLSWAELSIEIQTLIDSGAAGLFIDDVFVSKHSIPLQLRDTPLAIEDLDGRPLQPAHVTHETVLLSMAVEALHHEIIQFQVISFPKFPLVIGYPWLQRHNP
ncbi:hypothetical protein AB205_0127040, partial [Aquarana catesbeiana]